MYFRLDFFLKNDIIKSINCNKKPVLIKKEKKHENEAENEKNLLGHGKQ